MLPQDDMEMMLPLAVRWAQKLEERVALQGRALKEYGVDVARSVGVVRPDLIRVQVVDEMPMPAGPMLREMSDEIGIFTPRTIGITVGHSIVVKEGRVTDRLLQHEFRHVHQYEESGSLELFLEKYLRQVNAFGYRNAPLEVDARKHEVLDDR